MIASTPDPTPLVQMVGICKRFPQVFANDHIDLELHRSEIHALLGENGAGKSTLMKILYGFYRADEGRICMDGKEVAIRSPHDARRLNIGMVFQVLNLIPAMTVFENIALFLKDLPFVYNPVRVREQILKFSEQYDLKINPSERVSHLSIGEQQKVEILKLLISGAQCFILDEPTRVLAPHEIKSLYNILAHLKKDGYAIVLITHKLKEVLECADRITVLRNGKVAGHILRAEASEKRLIEMMFEKEVVEQISRQPTQPAASPALELMDISTHGEGAEVSLNKLSLKVFPGEIVGVAGVSGNGQKELCDVILSLTKLTSGQRLVNGADFTHASTRTMRDYGLGFIPENPLTMATVPFMSVLENMTLTRTKEYSRYGGLVMRWDKVREETRHALEKFGFNFSFFMPAKTLSGGNLQRLIIAREMMKNPKLIIASYLTRGLDVQSAIIARQELMRARNEGAGILLVSEDLEELFALSDRLVVLFDGKIVGEFKPAETDLFTIGHLMTGSEVAHDVAH